MTLREAIEFFFLRDSKKCIHFAYKNLGVFPIFLRILQANHHIKKLKRTNSRRLSSTPRQAPTLPLPTSTLQQRNAHNSKFLANQQSSTNLF